jgi:hypothetical protein
VKEHPILFTGEMVRALLAGTKTQTRRIMARQKQYDFTDYTLFGQQGHDDGEWKAIEHAPDWPDGKEDQCRCPYASRRGDRLWVRETCRGIELPSGLDVVRYIADGADAPIEDSFAGAERWLKLHTYRGKKGAIVPPIHMPRWASRIELEVTNVRIERLQAISEADARAEGAQPNDGYAGPSEDRVKGWRSGYRMLWMHLHGIESWLANPWVWVVEFNRMKP